MKPKSQNPNYKQRLKIDFKENSMLYKFYLWLYKKKVKNIIIKTLLIFIMISFLMVNLYFHFQNYPKEKPIQLDCNNLGVVYLKPTEKGNIDHNNPNIVWIIPESKEIIAKTEILECPMFDVIFDDYQKLIEMKGG